VYSWRRGDAKAGIVIVDWLGTLLRYTHTAFAVFGARQLLDMNYEGWVGVVPWILPTAIGLPATALYTRYYRRHFPEAAASGPGG
jgi:hypothetical protein